MPLNEEDHREGGHVTRSLANDVSENISERLPLYGGGAGGGSRDSFEHDELDYDEHSDEHGPVSSSLLGDISAMEYLTMVIIGASYLWPWNCYLSASAYFLERFDDYPFLARNFSSLVMSTTNVTATLLSFWLADHQNDSYFKRLYFAEISITVNFLILAVLCALEIPHIMYFIYVLASVLAASVATAFAQNASYSMASELGVAYTQAMMVGQALSGVIPPCISYLSALSGSETHVSASATAVYFLVASAVSLTAYLMFKVMIATAYPHCEYAGSSKALNLAYAGSTSGNDRLSLSSTTEEEQRLENEEDNNEDNDFELPSMPSSVHVPLSTLFRKLKAPAIAVFLTFSITLVYPVFTINIESSRGIRAKLFIPLIMLVWNWGDFSGRLVCMYQSLVVQKSHTMVVYALLRALFIPLFFMCNIHGHGVLRNDFLYVIIQFVFGFTNGHLASSSIMSAPLYVAHDEKEAAGGFLITALSIGLTTGSLLSFALVKVIPE